MRRHGVKLYLNEHEVEAFRRHALHIGKTEEWYQKWLDDCVIIVGPIEKEVKPQSEAVPPPG